MRLCGYRYTYTTSAQVYVNEEGQVRMNVSLREWFAALTPALPTGKEGVWLRGLREGYPVYIHFERSGVCKWATPRCDVFAAPTPTLPHGGRGHAKGAL